MCSTATDRRTGIISDQQVMLSGHYSAKEYPQHLQRTQFKDPGKTLIFLTNRLLGFEAHNAGCRHEIEVFARSPRVVALVDSKTDRSATNAYRCVPMN